MLPFYENLTRQLSVHRGHIGAFPAHLHSQLEVLLALEGTQKMTIGAAEYELPPGALALVFPHTVHSYHAGESGAPPLTLMLICPVEWTGDHQHALLNQIAACPVIDPQRTHPDIGRAMCALLGEEAPSPALCKAYAQLILARAMPELLLRRRGGAGHGDVIHQVIQLVSERFQEPLTLELLARQIGVSRYYLSRLFREKLHIGFREYVNSFRVELAKRLLRESAMSVLQVCFAAGFESQRSFNRQFKAQLGLSPGEYRSQRPSQP